MSKASQIMLSIATIFFVVIGLPLIYYQHLHLESNIRAIAIETFTEAFQPMSEARYHDPIRKWNGIERVCLIHKDSEKLSHEIESFLNLISENLNHNFRVFKVSDIIGCDQHSSKIFIVLSNEGNESSQKEYLSKIFDKRVAESYYQFGPLKGMSLTEAYPSNLTYIFVSTETLNGDNEDALYVALEEISHSLLGGGDVVTDSIVSILGEDASGIDSENWYERNPRGLCMIDLMYFELLLGDLPPDKRRFSEVLDFFSDNYDDVSMRAIALKEVFLPYLDKRCS
ncbi:MAG: hypothetical protein ABJN14_07510 [Paracoccaceae bacterium]